jgi:DNA-binding beta-propeller fold protein YncE
VGETSVNVHPGWAVPGGRVRLEGAHLPLATHGPPVVRVGSHEAHVAAASARALRIVVPVEAEGGAMAIRFGDDPAEAARIEVARTLATGIHQVDSPAFDGLGRLYVTHSGGRGTKVPVPIYRVGRTGGRDPVAVEIPNPTSLALGPDGAIYVSSRFEGQVYRLTTDDRVETYASELGVPTGLAFSQSGDLYVGDRSGSIFKIGSHRQVDTFATLPASVAAFHLAFGPDRCLYVTAPTLSSHDAVYRITPERLVEVVCDGLGRPQGLAFDRSGRLYVVDALAGAAGLYRLDVDRVPARPELVVSAAMLIGVAFDPDGGTVLASNETIWRVDNGLRPFAAGFS